MGSRPRRLSSQLLIVEGLDDQYVAEAIVRREGLDVTFAADPKRSVGALIRGMGADVKTPGVSALGFVFDANSDPLLRWEQVVHTLRGVRSVPRRPAHNGTIMEGTPKVGIWMMPDNGSPGELEDFVREMVPPGDAIWKLAESYIADLPPTAGLHASKHPTKAILHAWLATRRKPGRMATAIKDGDLDTSLELPQRYASWLRSLFGS